MDIGGHSGELLFCRVAHCPCALAAFRVDALRAGAAFPVAGPFIAQQRARPGVAHAVEDYSIRTQGDPSGDAAAQGSRGAS